MGGAVVYMRMRGSSAAPMELSGVCVCFQSAITDNADCEVARYNMYNRHWNGCT